MRSSDPLGSLYRFTMASSYLKGAKYGPEESGDDHDRM